MEYNFTNEDFNQFYRFCFSLAKNEDDAYDLLHTSIEKLLKSPVAAKLENIKPYLYSIIRHQFIDDKRYQNRWRMEDIDISSNVALIDIESLNEKLIAKDQCKRILNKLTPADREILYLWAVESYTVVEISQHLGIPKGTLLSKLHRIKKNLQKLLKADYPEHFKKLASR